MLRAFAQQRVLLRHHLPAVPRLQARVLSSTLSTEEDRYIQTSLLPTMYFQPGLMRLPIPDIGKSVQRYLAALEPVAESREAFEKTKEITSELMNKQMLQQLQVKLILENRQNKESSYISRPWFNMYLSDRRPLVLNYNPFLAFKQDPDITDQAMRAANFVWSAVRFRASLLDEQLEPEVFHLNPTKTNTQKYRKTMKWLPRSLCVYVSMLMRAFPLDMSQYSSLLNTTRIPLAGAQDELVSFESSDHDKYGHVLVLRNDNMYTVQAVQKDGLPVPCQTLYNQLQGILNDETPPSPHPLGCLTGLDRDRWARLRVMLGHENLDQLEAIDSALFVLCLDDVAPTSPETLTHQMLHNYGRNRWFDKSVQLIVTPEGFSAINFEHSWGDGVAVLRFFEETYKDRKQYLSYCEPTMEGVKQLEFSVPAEVKQETVAAVREVKESCDNLSVHIMQYHRYGKDFIKKMKLSPDAVLQLAIQVAYYRQFKRCVPTYESCSTAAFKLGRTETIRPASEATKACAHAFEVTSENFDPHILINLITKATEHHFKLTKEAAMGQGFDRHLFALRDLAEREGAEVALFQDPSYAHMNHIILSTSTLPSDAVLSGGFAPVTPDGYGVGYGLHDDWIGVQVTTYPTRDGRQLIEHLEKVLNDFYAVFTSKSREQ